jgi:hypothetical protein
MPFVNTTAIVNGTTTIRNATKILNATVGVDFNFTNISADTATTTNTTTTATVLAIANQVFNNTNSGWFEDDTRGSLGIIWSCLFTHFLCIWTAVHANLDSPRPDGLWQRFKYSVRPVFGRNLIARLTTHTPSSKLEWCVRLLFVPELALSEACLELDTACQLKRLANTTPPHGESPVHSDCCPTQNKRAGVTQKWDMEHAFMVILGGLKFHIKGEDSKFVTQTGFRKLATFNMLPSARFFEQEINGRREKNWISKIQTFLQLGWFSLQYFSRFHARLPITLLESITIGHILYSSLLYIFWFYKPQGIKKPVELDFRYCPDCQLTLQKNHILADFESLPAMGTTEVADMKRVRLDPGNNINRWGLFSIVTCAVLDTVIVIRAPRGQGFVPTGELLSWWVGLFALIVGKLLIGWSAGLAPVDGPYLKKRQVLCIGIVLSVASKLLFFIIAFLSFRTMPPEVYLTPRLANLLPHIG